MTRGRPKTTTSNEFEQISAMRNSGLQWEEIGRTLGITAESARNRFRRMAKSLYSDGPSILNETIMVDDEIEEESLEKYNKAFAIFKDTKSPKYPSWREIVEIGIKNQTISEEASIWQKYATVEIRTQKPIVVMYTGDWHFGSRINYEEWYEDIDALLSNDNVFMIELGDDRENMRTFKNLASVLSQTMTPEQQAMLIRGIIDELTEKNKILAKVAGNHDKEFDERIFGATIQNYLLANMKAPRFSNRGILKLIVGNITYTNLLFHKSRFRSFLRGAHGGYREYTLSFPADVVAGGHDHVPAFEEIWHYTDARKIGMDFGGSSYLIKVGSMQQGDFGWKYFHGEAYVSPCVVYFPDQHKKVYFSNPKDAIRYAKTF